MEIVDFARRMDLRGEVAQMLLEGFRDRWPSAWPDLVSATAEVDESLGAGRISLLAVESDVLAGWIGAIKTYNHAWELHPLVVSEGFRGRGVGRTLVAALEDRIADAGDATIYLGTDDQDGSTTVSGIDLYPDPLAHLLRVEGNHPFRFYRRLGYAVVGIIPDANGPGQPDILMAKRIVPGKPIS